MADEVNKTDADNTTGDSPVRVKRHIKQAPETIRSRTEKLQNAVENKENQPTSPVRIFFRGFFWLPRLIGRNIAKLNRFKVFRAIGLVLLPRYVRNSWRELRKVTWPDFRQTWRLTYAVLIFSIIFGAVVFVIDLGLDKLFKEFILK